MAADTYSPSLGAIEQGTGNNNNSWGTNLNGALTALDLGAAGYVSYAVTGGNLAKDGVVPPAGQHPLVQMVVNFTGVLASDQTVTVPNVSKIWLVENGCSGAFTLKFKTTSGTAGAAIPQNGMAIVICDGANGIFVALSTSLRDVQWLGADGTLALPGVSFTNEATLGLRRVSAGVMALTVGGVDIVTISGTAVTIASGASFSVVPPGSEMPTASIRAPTGWYFEYGQAVTRAGDPGLLAALTEGFTANTNGTTTISNVSKDLRNLGLEGSALEGTGMATGATIVSIAATSMVLSIAATNTATGGAVTAFPYGNGDGSTTFTLPDARGTVAAGRDNMGPAGTAARGKLTTAGSAVDGTKLLTDAGAQSVTLLTTNLPPYTPSGTITNGAITISHNAANTGVSSAQAGGGVLDAGNPATITASQATSTFTGTAAPGQNSTAFGIVQPTRIRNVLIKR